MFQDFDQNNKGNITEYVPRFLPELNNKGNNRICSKFDQNNKGNEYIRTIRFIVTASTKGAIIVTLKFLTL